MASIGKKNFTSPDEVMTFDKGKAEVVKVGDVTFKHQVFDPGWQWSKSLKEKMGTDSCQSLHTVHVISGKLHVKMDDGTDMEFGPGDVGVVPPGHDAWVVGEEPMVAIDVVFGTQ